MNTINNFKRTCFFCSEPIIGKKTLEHIIPNALLRKLGIKKEKMNVNGATEYEYSRIRVPAHSECNSGFGSQYESEVINLLSDSNELYRLLTEEDFGIPVLYSPDKRITSTISTWLMKIYYGLFYHDYLKTRDDNWKEISKNLIECYNFELIRNSYKNNHGFFIPSSLFVFKNNDNTNFDLRTIVDPQCILMKIKSLSFILCIGDGYLTKNYLNNDILQCLRDHLDKIRSEHPDFPTHLYALAEILALRTCIPKAPSFSISNNEIINMSLSTMVKNPETYYAIDDEKLDKMRKLFLADFNIQ